MSRMHRFHVLHCDIHPGDIADIAFTSCLSVGEMLPDSKDPRPLGMLIPTFIDLEWARIEGHHCRLDESTPTCWVYSSDRVMYREERYCEADDFVSLAYVILAFALMAQPPWVKKMQDSMEMMDLDLLSTRKKIVNTRKRCLQRLRRSEEVEGLIPDFISESYAEQLPFGKKPDYKSWADQFDRAAAAAQVSAGDSEVYAHML